MVPELTLIAAMDQRRLIGNGDKLPWNLPADLRHFRRQTIGKPILMGRKTYESIGRPLPKRRNLVLTRRADVQIPGVEVFNSFNAAIQAAKDETEVMVIGGAHVYASLLQQANRMLLTVIHSQFIGDVYFPKFDTNEWSICSRHDHKSDTENQWPYSFLELKRTRTGSPIPNAFPLGL